MIFSFQIFKRQWGLYGETTTYLNCKTLAINRLQGFSVLEAGMLYNSLRPLLQGLPITFKWSATELDTFNTFLTLFEVILCRSLVECYLTLLS